jgi:DNA repair protein RadC
MLLQVKDRVLGNSPSKLADLVRSYLMTAQEHDQRKEHLWVIGLDTKKFVRYVDLVSLGTLECSLVHPREVFTIAVREQVSCIALAHNHPSGDPSPSDEDRIVTTRIRDAGRVLGIPVIDHVIVGSGSDYYSFMDKTSILG